MKKDPVHEKRIFYLKVNHTCDTFKYVDDPIFYHIEETFHNLISNNDMYIIRTHENYGQSYIIATHIYLFFIKIVLVFHV